MERIDLAGLLGGIGLFLLGMTMMTDGLKMALGPALSRLLQAWTATRLRGLLFGVLATALVQSSTAITVATIGFVNAGLLSLGQSLWVIFGSNLGSTFTGWLVAMIGFKLKLEVAALPMIGVGILLRLSGAETRRGALGGAIGGLGVLFLGIDFLQQAFVAGGDAFDFEALSGYGFWSLLAFVLAGTVLTVLLQASAATLAIVLTLAEAGVLPLTEAAAMVIGANIGTTATALIATIGATPNARRAALAHVAFNILAGGTALLGLPWILDLLAVLRDALALGNQPAMTLALFHTAQNLIGILLMWPLSERLANFLRRCFLSQEEEIGRPHYIDRNVGAVPSLAVDALHREISRAGHLVLERARARCAMDEASLARVDAFPALARAIVAFVTEVNRHPMPADTAANLALLLRVHRYYDTCHELAAEAARTQAALPALDSELAGDVRRTLDTALALLQTLDPGLPGFARPGAEALNDFESAYQCVKAALLQAGASGRLDIDRMDEAMSGLSALRRLLEQARKAAGSLAELAPQPIGTPTAATQAA